MAATVLANAIAEPALAAALAVEPNNNKFGPGFYHQERKEDIDHV